MPEPFEMMLSLPLVLDEREVMRFTPLTTSVSLSIASQQKNSFHWSAIVPPSAPAPALMSPIVLIPFKNAVFVLIYRHMTAIA